MTDFFDIRDPRLKLAVELIGKAARRPKAPQEDMERTAVQLDAVLTRGELLDWDSKEAQVQMLNWMAGSLVGDGQQPNLYFVTRYDDHGGSTVGIADNLYVAVEIARQYEGPVMIEDRLEGVVWENEESLRYQEDEEANPKLKALKARLLR